MGKSTHHQALINRGSLIFWIDEEALSAWLCSVHHSKRGRGYQYPDNAIMTALMVKRLFNLSLRAVQGFMDSVLSLMKVPFASPNYSSISKRAKMAGLIFRSKCLLEVKFIILLLTQLV